MMSNAELKTKFIELHKLVVDLNLSSVIDELFSEEIISAADLHDLNLQKDVKQQTKNLLVLLHNSQNPMTFIKLREAIAKEKAYSYFIQTLDELKIDSVPPVDPEKPEQQVQPVTQRVQQQNQQRGASNVIRRSYAASPHLSPSLRASGGDIYGITWCDNKLFVLCQNPQTISVYGPDNEPLENIELDELKYPSDVASCDAKKQLYIAATECVWRVSTDGRQVHKWLTKALTTAPSTFTPFTLSVTSGRLLVTTHHSDLFLFSLEGDEQNHISLPRMKKLEHAVETSRGTFIVSHREPRTRVCEVGVDGQEICVYNDQEQLSRADYLALDSDGRIFVADGVKHRVLLLSAVDAPGGRRLKLEQVLLDKRQHQLDVPSRLCYVDHGETVRLFVGSYTSNCVQVFTWC